MIDKQFFQKRFDKTAILLYYGLQVGNNTKTRWQQSVIRHTAICCVKPEIGEVITMSKHFIWTRFVALLASCCLCIMPAAAYNVQAMIAPVAVRTTGVGTANLVEENVVDEVNATINAVTSAASSEGTVRSVAQVDSAAEADEAAKALAAEQAAAAAAKAEAARQAAALVYAPSYNRTVQYVPTAAIPASVQANGTLLGKYKLTFYCGCEQCCGKWSNGITSSGVTAAEGRTIAVDPSVIPIGSKVYIEGFGDFIAEDVGGAIKGNKIDIYLNDHSRCNDLGVKYANVFVVR